MIKLSNRLKCAADMLWGNTKIVDIGTDHAYLPAYIVENKICTKVLACDIGKMPLENARKTLNIFDIEDRIELRISDGLKSVYADEADEITICGMGGNLIVDILSAVDWIKKDNLHLVLQPMTHLEDVRKFLCTNGFAIINEKYCEDSGRIYCVFDAVYMNNKLEFNEGYFYFGNFSLNDALALQFCKKQYERINKKINGIKVSNSNIDLLPALYNAAQYYEKRLKNDY